MKTIHKRLLAGVAVAALGFGSTAVVSAPWGDCAGYGQGGAGYGHGKKGQQRGDPGQRAEMRQQRWEERMALLESRLNLNDEQQDAWQSFRAALDAQHRSMAGQRPRPERSGMNVMQQFDARIAFMEARLAGMRAMSKAVDDLYAGLSDAQKAVMDEFFANQSQRGPRGGGARTS
jgi:uncharacterized coiled-coil protein SlyX